MMTLEGNMHIRLAQNKDIDQLIQMRWDFTVEHKKEAAKSNIVKFQSECRLFLEHAIESPSWFIWIAEINEQVVSHIYLELIHKVPRPGRITHPFVYMTNVYTIPEHRNKGVGSQLLTVVNKWMETNEYEFVIVWPSDDSIAFYERNSYVNCNEAWTFTPSRKS